MGNCLNCGGTIPDGTTFCDEHKFDPGKVLRVENEPDSGLQDPPTGGGGGGWDAPNSTGGDDAPASDPPTGGGGGG